MLRAGFIGLGNIGKPMAERIAAAGIPLAVYDVAAPAAAALAAAGAKAMGSAREVAVNVDVLGICVRDDRDLAEVMAGPDGILAGAKPGLVVAVHSTVLPRSVVELGAAAARARVGVVDACITGGAIGAAAGTLTYIVGGDDAHVERCRPVFETSGKRIIHTGALGSGAATKLCNNLMTYLGFLAAYEATMLARGGGLSEKALEDVTSANGNLTEQMKAFLALHKLPPETRADPGFQSLIDGFATLAEKDLDVTLAFAQEHGVELPGTERCRDLIATVYGAKRR